MSPHEATISMSCSAARSCCMPSLTMRLSSARATLMATSRQYLLVREDSQTGAHPRLYTGGPHCYQRGPLGISADGPDAMGLAG